MVGARLRLVRPPRLGRPRRRCHPAFRRLAHFDRSSTTSFVNGAFDEGCEELSDGGGLLARVQTGRVQTYLRLLAWPWWSSLRS